jgi:MFS family permease
MSYDPEANRFTANMVVDGTETTPLLTKGPQPEKTTPTDAAAAASHQTKVVRLCLLIVFCVEFGTYMLAPPWAGVLEDVICRELNPTIINGFWNGKLANDVVCKHADVHSAMAKLRGWAATFDCIPGLLCVMAFGLLSDKWGRRPVLKLALVGILLSLMWTSFVCKLFSYPRHWLMNLLTLASKIGLLPPFLFGPLCWRPCSGSLAVVITSGFRWCTP